MDLGNGVLDHVKGMSSRFGWYTLYLMMAECCFPFTLTYFVFPPCLQDDSENAPQKLFIGQVSLHNSVLREVVKAPPSIKPCDHVSLALEYLTL